MPPEPLPFDRQDFLKDRKPSSLDPLGIVQPRWREPPTTPSQHNNRGSSSSCRWGSGGGPSDFRRPFSDFHGKRVGGGWHNTTVESGSKENSCITNSVSMPFGSQKDPKAGVNSWKTTASASPNGNSLLHNDQLQSVDQHAKNSGGGFSTTSSQRLEKENSLGASLDWKPVKWIRSGSLSSRGSGFSHSSGCKIIGVDPLNTSSPLRSPSEDASQCVTPNTPDEANSRKKQRLGWGEGLAKYEKKVDPDDIVDKEAGVRNGMVDGVSGSEPLLTSPYNMSDKSPSVNGYSECASPTTPYSFACSSSTGLEEKESTKTVTVDTSVASCHLSENHTEQLSSNLENLEHNLSFSIDELLQTDDSRSPGSGFVKSTAMEKLQVWKAELTRTLEITETEIDSLENELKSLVSDGGSCAPPASNSFLTVTVSNHKTSEETCGPLPVEKTDSSPEGLNGVDDDSDGKSPGTTSKFVNCSEDVGNDDMLGFVASCGDGNEVPTGSSSTDSDGEDVDNGREDNKLYGLIVATNKAIANRASDELSRLLLPTTHLCTNISKATDESSNKIKFASRKRFLKFKERVITSKFRALQYSWKEELHSLSLKKIGAKSQKKFESSSRMGYADHQKCRSPGGSLTLVPTTETLDYVKKLLSDSRVKVHKKALKMPCLILDRSERMMTRFISDNGLVENPVDIEKERSIVNPWTEKETEIFLEKYSLFGKDFKKIASFLESRTIGDCVEFYYKNHKSDCFQNAKKNSKFAKGKSCSTITTNTYLVTSGRRMNSEGGGGGGAGATSLEMLGAASAMVANVDSQQKNYYVGTSNDPRLLPSEGLSDFAMSCNEQETAAADVLAGICGSISSEALGSCITSSVDHGDVHHHHGRRSLKLDGDDVDEDTCSDDSCDEDMDASYWTDEEKSRFIKAFRSHGKDFSKISRSMRTKTSDQCRVFFSKARKCLGLDVNDAEGGSEGNNESDDEDAFMVENDGSDISHGKSSLECSKMDDLVENNINADVGERRSSNGCDSSASCPKVEGKVSRELTTCPVEDLNKATLDLDSRFDDDDDDGNGGGLKSSGSEKAVADNGFLMMSNFFPGDSSGGVVEDKDRKKTLSPCSQDDVSSRLSFRKSCDNKMYERCSNLPKHSLLDCAESSQILRGYPVVENKLKLDKNLLITSVDVEKEKAKSRSGGGGDVKLFGQILTKRPQVESVVNDKKAASSSLNVDHSNNVTIRSPHGYWDGKKVQMQMGVAAIPDSERLLAKYPAAFSKTSAFLSFDRNHQFRSSTSLRMVSGFEACSSSGVEGFTVDKLLLPRKGGGMSDPVAAIRRHYANRGEEYKSGSGDI